MAAGDDETPGFSRRDALRKLGVAAGVAWTAPVVFTLHNAAAAGTPVGPTTPTSEEPPPCTGATCDTYVPGCSSNTSCICVKSSQGEGVCIPDNIPCDTLETCGPGNTCPTGSFCAVETCCLVQEGGDEVRPVCVPFDFMTACPPGSGFAPPPGPRARARAGRMTIGGGAI